MAGLGGSGGHHHRGAINERAANEVFAATMVVGGRGRRERMKVKSASHRLWKTPLFEMRGGEGGGE